MGGVRGYESAPGRSGVLLVTDSRAVYSAITGGRLVRVEEAGDKAPIEADLLRFTKWRPPLGIEWLRREGHMSGDGASPIPMPASFCGCGL